MSFFIADGNGLKKRPAPKQHSILTFLRSTSLKKSCIPSDSCINKDADESNSYCSSHDNHANSDEMSEKPDSGELDIANVIKLPLQDITYEVKCMLIKKCLPPNCEKSIKFFKKS